MTIALEAVSFSYQPGGAGVRAVSMTIGDGELMAVIGPSGCGKSTVLKLIAGFLIPQSGRILIGGQDMGATPPRDRDLGVVFQSYALFPHMSLAENVGYPLKLRHIPREDARRRVDEALAMVGLAALADRSPRSLSGGQQQRVALARALVFRPRALLLDEPLSALDATLRSEMRDEIRRLQRQYGIATLHITHDQEEALSMADRVAVMRAGEVLQVATPRELYRTPVNREVAAFVGHANLFEGTVVDRTRVSTALGELACAPHGFAPRTTVCVLIRPEAITVCRHPVPDAVPVTVLRDRFLGSVRRLDVQLRSGPTLLAETTEPDLDPQFIVLPPAAVQVIASSAANAGSDTPRPSSLHPPD
ncbi:MAG: ABC transporter ATP-binding protein [Alphaproteobacteria bacterium]|nr:MAG: ABC transporter ATP-binding protein [Alphaproteobacteria bacterium]